MLAMVEHNSIIKRKVIIHGIFALYIGLVVFFSGFFAMLMFWKFNTYTSDKGLFSYYAASYGDAIALPLFAFSLSFYWFFHRKKARLFSKVSVIILAASFIAGVVVQISWLVSSKTIPNWTISPDYLDKMPSLVQDVFYNGFNCPGTVHAIFFSGMMGLSGFLLCNFVRVRKSTASAELGSDISLSSLWLFAFSICYYLNLHFLDDGIAFLGITSSQVLPILTIVTITVCLIISIICLLSNSIAFKASRFKELMMVFSGCFTAFSIALVTLNLHKNIFWFLASSILFSSGLWIYNIKGKLLWCHDLFVITSLLSGSAIICSHLGLEGVLVFSVFALSFVFLLMLKYKQSINSGSFDSRSKAKQHKACERRYISIILLFAYLVFYYCLKCTNHETLQELKSVISDLSFLPLTLGTFTITQMFRQFSILETAQPKEEEAVVKRIKLIQYLKILAVATPCVIWSVRETFYETQSLQYLAFRPIDSRISIVLLLLGAFILILMFFFRKVLHRIRLGKAKYVSVLLVGLVYLCIAGAIIPYLDKPSPVFNSHKAIKVFYLVSLLCQIIGTTSLTAFTFYYNTYIVRGFIWKVGRSNADSTAMDEEAGSQARKVIHNVAKVTSALIFIGSAVVFSLMWVIMFSQGATTISPSILCHALLGSCIVLVVIPSLFSFVLVDSNELPTNWSDFVSGSSYAEVAKDGLTTWAIMILAAGVPFYVLNYSIEKSKPILLVANIVFYMSSLTFFLLFCIKNNRIHLREMIEQGFSKPKTMTEEKKEQGNAQLKGLSQWLRKQSIFAIIACLLYGAVILLFKSLWDFLKEEDQAYRPEKFTNIDAWNESHKNQNGNEEDQYQ